MQGRNPRPIDEHQATHGSVYVFIYGTLRAGESNDIALVARRHELPEPERVGATSVPGTLHDFGDYPGWVPGGHAATRVTGDVYRIAPALVPVLDDIEEVYPGTPGLFIRTTLPVPCAGSTHLCIAYPVDAAAAAGRAVIEGGDWVAHRLARTPHAAQPHEPRHASTTD